ncbi:hypothetical protein SLEP1_g42611 [Rubroshorea leprosula]|uniref:NAC domain-containing protein n=1 Tax=Rubroshorea leprosula TaxID=152421 RepID=A0AAV5LAT9_9ROSI|nr:hypothetical protein SLEP1_g42611 [Rubroshorea leprosula]
MGRDSATSLAPGFRFHPTDEELVRYYLKRKVCKRPFRFNPISDVDVYKSEPWDLPGKSKLKTRDLEWYFFSVLDKKYGNGSRTNRATEKGYWKTTGKDKSINHNSRIVGMKKTLVYHNGRAPNGERTNWVMHEYRLADEDLEKAGVQQDAFVLCRIFQKSGSGPKNGEQYGAPFIEEEWEDDQVALVPGLDTVAHEVAFSDDAFVGVNDMNQNPDINNPSEESPSQLNFYYGESSNHVEHSREFSEDGQKPVICMQEAQCGTELHYRQMFSNLPQQNEIDSNMAIDENGPALTNNVIAEDVEYFPAEPYLDADDNRQLGDDGLYLEANDLSNFVEADSVGFNIDDFLTFGDAADEHLAFDPAQMMGSEIAVTDQEFPAVEHLNGGTEEVPISSQQPVEAHDKDHASSSEQKPEAALFEKDVNYPFIKKASHMLGSFPAPPALASEFPTKDMALQLNAATQSSSSFHVTTGMIRITNMTLSGNGSLGKNGNANIVVSFGLLQDAVNPSGILPIANLLSGKTGSMMSRLWLFLTFFWVLILPLSFKIGTHINAK